MRQSCALAIFLLGLPIARAADTVEAFDAGALDLESHIGIESLSQPTTGVASELVLGYGVADRLSATVALELEDASVAGVAAGVIATALDTDHLDLDLLLTLGAGPPSLGTIALAPAIELNLDRSPNLGSYGLYLRLALPLEAPLDGPDRPLRVRLEAVGGAYVTLATRHQLLLEHESSLDDPGTLALGYNVTLDDTWQLVSAARFGLPFAGEPATVGLVFGVIVTLPGPLSPRAWADAPADRRRSPSP